MMNDADIRKSVNEYVKRVIKEIPSELDIIYPGIKRVWDFENELDFLYGYYVGKLEAWTIQFLLKAKRASYDVREVEFEIREIIEMHKQEIRDSISKSISSGQ